MRGPTHSVRLVDFKHILCPSANIKLDRLVSTRLGGRHASHPLRRRRQKMCPKYSTRSAVGTLKFISLLSVLWFTVVWYDRAVLSNARVNSSLHFPDGYSAYCDEAHIGHKQAWNRHKKVISYALFQEQPTRESPAEDSFTFYFEGALQNIKGSKLYYPDWVVRIYAFGLQESMESLLLEASDNVELVRCSVTSP